MTLVVGRSNDTGLTIMSDTRASFVSRDASRTRVEPRAANPIEGVLKAVLLNESQCVCFSGDVGVAYSMIDGIVAEGLHMLLDDEAVLARLVATHAEGNGGADFVLGSVVGRPVLHEVKDGTVRRNARSVWLGSADAYSEYQRHYAAAPEDDELARVETAMQRLLNGERLFDDVGDFLIGVGTEPDGLVYLPHTSAWFPPAETTSEEWTTVDMGSAADGAYSYAVLCPRGAGGFPFVAVYFALARFGVVFAPFHSRAAFVMDGVSPDEFVACIERDSGTVLRGAINTGEHILVLRPPRRG